MVRMITRFAPSPTGQLHLGHAASALFASKLSSMDGGDFLLRIEDIDAERCKSAYTKGIYEDLLWLGFKWPEPVRIQSQHMDSYKDALNRLDAMGLLYPCYCTRKEIRAEAMAAGQAPHANDIGFTYEGLCKTLSVEERSQKDQSREPVLRLDMDKALAKVGKGLVWHDESAGDVVARPDLFGDVVLARRDIPTCYHLSVTLDDALQNVDLVTRGQDLFVSTHIHRLLQELLDLPTPLYNHHPLLTDKHGQRLAKRDGSISICALREAGETRESVLAEFNGAVEAWLGL